MADDTKSYVLRTGRRMTIEGKTYGGGETVKLTETQARAWADLVDIPGSKKLKTEAPTDSPRATSHVPQDIGSKVKNPNQPDVNPGNRVGMRPGAALNRIPLEGPANPAVLPKLLPDEKYTDVGAGPDAVKATPGRTDSKKA